MGCSGLFTRPPLILSSVLRYRKKKGQTPSFNLQVDNKVFILLSLAFYFSYFKEHLGKCKSIFLRWLSIVFLGKGNINISLFLGTATSFSNMHPLRVNPLVMGNNPPPSFKSLVYKVFSEMQYL